MGTTAGTTILVISGTVVMWPLSDLFFGPKLIQLGLYCHDGSAQEKASEDDSFASITIVANRSGRDIRREAEKNNRPVVYISLREATSSHDLFMVMVSGLFSYEKLGIIGTLSQSMGIWWIVLFDAVMGTDPPHTRKVHFSVLLQHTKRALQMHTALYPHSRRCATRERKAPLPPLSFILYSLSLSSVSHDQLHCLSSFLSPGFGALSLSEVKQERGREMTSRHVPTIPVYHRPCSSSKVGTASVVN